jgi:hypothetical protein|tara:strand:+ start:149 stop:625 length:477 start_codon:yes stop_codon:yes gene_type:complete
MQTTNYDMLIIIITVAILICVILFFLAKKVSSRENKINDITSIIQKIKFLFNITIKEKDDKKLKVWHLALIVVIFSWGAILSERPEYTLCECKDFWYNNIWEDKNWSEGNTCVKDYVYNKEKGGIINTNPCLTKAWNSGALNKSPGDFAVRAWACDCE